MTDSTAPSPRRSVERLRHPLKARMLEVLRVQRPSAHFVRVSFGGEALRGFASASFDDHLKLMLPAPGQAEPVLPDFEAEKGSQWPVDAVRPAMRDYTPGRYDAGAGELDIEFVLHGDGPAASWAAQAAPGQRVGIGGPRGSFVIPMDYDWHLLVGDETAMPAIERRLRELPAGSRVFALVQVADEADRRSFATQADLALQWVAAGDDALAAAVQQLALPAGEGYAWAAGEAHAIAAVRRVLVATHELDKEHIRAAAYWKRGAVAHHETLGD